MFSLNKVLLCSLALLAVPSTSMVAAQTCPAGALATPKEQALYLLFPTSESVFRVGDSTYSVDAFDVAELDPSIGTTPQLRNRIFDIVRDTFCEFSVDVRLVTSTPFAGAGRWQIVGIDSAFAAGTFGHAYNEDEEDTEGQDFARVSGGAFSWEYGILSWEFDLEDGPLEGVFSTLERWATAIAGTTAHEAGHNYGLFHRDATPRPGSIEDDFLNHTMIAGSSFGDDPFTQGDNRAKRIRHFSDRSFEILGHNIGLNSKTLSNWDLVNPNADSATELVMTLLSRASSLEIILHYSGSESPWTNPRLVRLPGEQVFHGDTFNIYELAFQEAQPWRGGSAGMVPPGIGFHVGVALNDTAQVREITLRNSTGDMRLKPRMAAYDATLMRLDGLFAFALNNPFPEDSSLLIEDLELLFLPRPLSLENMVRNGKPISRDGLPISPFQRQLAKSNFWPPQDAPERIFNQHNLNKGGVITLAEETVIIPLALLSDQRHVDLLREATSDCVPGVHTEEGIIPFKPNADSARGEVIYCTDETALSLFPASYTYIKATIVDPHAEHWDPAQNRMITGPLRTRLYYQVAGTIPDLNTNGQDDLLDIRAGSRDSNANGVPDEVELRSQFLTYQASIGVTSPHSGQYDSGFSMNLGLEYRLTQSISLDLSLGHHQLASGAAPLDLDLWQLSLGGRFSFPPRDRWRTFLNASTGAYFTDSGDVDPGISLGVGVDFAFSPDLALEASVHEHRVFSGSTHIEWAAFQLGLKWGI